MKKITGIKWAVALTLCVTLLVAFREPTEKYFEIAKSLDIFATLFKEVNAYYVDEVEPKQLIRNSIDGMLESLDPYTDYIAEDELESFRINTTGQYAGIGAYIGVINTKIVITHPYAGYPAYEAGLHVGDEIIGVDGQSMVGKTTADVSASLKGQPHTDVELKIKRMGTKEPLTFKIKRKKISIRNVVYSGIVAPGVGYIKLDDFTPGASREVSDAVVSLKEQGARKLILDLRDNPGGLLHEAVNIVSLFIPKGYDVVSTKGKVSDWNKTYTTLNNPVDTEIPLAVLTSGGSASASEIVAGALQDYDRAILVGQKTFGKGLVQTTRPLAYNAQLKVTTAKYYTPSGRCIQALDYTHRKADGTVERVADSLKSEFKTKGGRKVFDGAGLDPDVPVKSQYPGAVTIELLNDGLLFDYATKYRSENPAPADWSTFALSDQDYKKFVTWVREQNFEYSTELEKRVDDLTASAKQEKYFSELEAQVSTLKAKVEANKAQDFERFKNEIKNVLEQQIAFHYALDKGQIEVSTDQDEEILAALRALADKAQYQKLLSPGSN